MSRSAHRIPGAGLVVEGSCNLLAKCLRLNFLIFSPTIYCVFCGGLGTAYFGKYESVGTSGSSVLGVVGKDDVQKDNIARAPGRQKFSPFSSLFCEAQFSIWFNHLDVILRLLQLIPFLQRCTRIHTSQMSYFKTAAKNIIRNCGAKKSV